MSDGASLEVAALPVSAEGLSTSPNGAKPEAEETPIANGLTNGDAVVSSSEIAQAVTPADSMFALFNLYSFSHSLADHNIFRV